LTETELKKLSDSYDVALIGLLKDNHVQRTYKGSVTKLLILIGVLMVDLHEDTGIALEDLGEGIKEVAAKEIALREKKK
jgi:hypothetical protein